MSDPEDAAALFARGGWNPSVGWEAPPPESLDIPGVHSLVFAGRGGMGAVYRGIQSSLERAVAIKILPGANVISRERFIREARILAALEHPHILRIIDFGETSSGILYLVMEWAACGDLATKLSERDPQQILQWITQIASGLDFAHQAGVIHRDLKPGNLLLDRHGHIKIGDFGLARAVGPGFTTGLTLSGSTLGTLDYMAPEQFSPDSETTVQTDIYALGVLTYQMLTGRLPKGSFQPASALAKIPRAVDAVISKALAQDPGHRYASAGEYRHALAAAMGKRSKVPLLAIGLLAVAGGYWFVGRAEAPPTSVTMPTPAPTALPTQVPIPLPTPSPVPSPSSPAWTNLLPSIQPARDTRSGQWQLTSAGLTSNAERCILALPFQAGENYDIRVRFTRLSGRHSVVFFLPTRSGPATFELDAWERQLGGLQDIDGSDMRSLERTFPAPLANGAPQELLLEVRSENVRCHWNERTVEWPISGHRLSINALWQTNQPALPGVGSWESPTQFHEIVVRSIEP